METKKTFNLSMKEARLALVLLAVMLVVAIVMLVWVQGKIETFEAGRMEVYEQIVHSAGNPERVEELEDVLKEGDWLYRWRYSAISGIVVVSLLLVGMGGTVLWDTLHPKKSGKSKKKR